MPDGSKTFGKTINNEIVRLDALICHALGVKPSITYKYGNVAFAPESEKQPDGTLPMKFDYTVMENFIEADTESQEFINHIGDILVVLLDEKLKEDGKNRANNT